MAYPVPFLKLPSITTHDVILSKFIMNSHFIQLSLRFLCSHYCLFPWWIPFLTLLENSLFAFNKLYSSSHHGVFGHSFIYNKFWGHLMFGNTERASFFLTDFINLIENTNTQFIKCFKRGKRKLWDWMEGLPWWFTG